MVSTATASALLPTEICGCSIERSLGEGSCFIAAGPGGRTVVLKKLDSDCLHGAGLHPVVRDRLARVRGLAHAGVANLFGVEREDEDAYLIWEYVEGLSFDLHVSGDHTPREIASVARELILAVDLLHMQGVIHGALVPSNVFVLPGGAVRLTHVSPLVYSDPQVDVDCVWNLIEFGAEALGERGAPLARMVVEARNRKVTLRELARLIGPFVDAREARKQTPEPEADAAPRRRALYGAGVVLALGLAVAFCTWRVIDGGRLPLPDRLHLPFHAQGDR